MKGILNFFDGSPFSIYKSFIGVIGITLSIYYYSKAKKEKRPLYDFNTSYVLYSNSSLNDIKIKYKGQKIEKLQLTRISFWNGGKDTIRKIDLTERNPVVILFDEKIVIFNIDIMYIDFMKTILEQLKSLQIKLSRV